MGSCLKRTSSQASDFNNYRPNDSLQITSKEKLLNTSGQANNTSFHNEESYHIEHYKANTPGNKHLIEDLSIKQPHIEEKPSEE